MVINSTKLRQKTFWISIFSVLPHIFCCGIPAMVALISLGTTVGLAGALAANPLYNFVDTYHEILITVAVLAVVLSGFANFIAWRIDCRNAAHSTCAHDSCAPKKNSSLKIFVISCVLLVLDLAWFAVEKFELGLHHVQ